MAESVIDYAKTVILSFGLFSFMCFAPGVIIFSTYKHCVYRCKKNQSLSITVILFALSVALSIVPFLYTMLKYEEGPFDVITYLLIGLPYTVIGCSFLIVPVVFLFLFIIRRVEKRDVTVLKKPFLIIEGIAMFLGLITAIVMIKNN